MTRTLSMAQLKAHLSEVVGEVQHTGGEVVIKKHGKPVVKIVPVAPEKPRLKGFAALAGLAADAPEFTKVMEQIVRERRLDKPRRVPSF